MAASSSSCEEAPNLDLGHRIFLSHSGADKEFVRLLFQKLKDHWYIPFFDEPSLPKGKIVTMANILKEVQYCKLGLLVLSEEFFTINKNAVMELIAFVKSEVPLLPVFYKLTVAQVKDETYRARWRAKWEEWNVQSDDSSLGISMWEKALNKVTDLESDDNHLEYGTISSNYSDFLDEIAEKVSGILLPDSLWDDKLVVGKERLLQEVDCMFSMCPVVEGRVRTLALHGIEGMGKTKLGQALCNFYLTEFGGRVCYMALHEGSRLDRIREILRLTKASYKHIERFTPDEGKAMEILYSQLSSANIKKFFLVVDDIQDSFSDHIEVCELFLNNLHIFPEGSKLLLLARSFSTLLRLLSGLRNGSSSTHCIRTFPGLNFLEAKIVLQTESPLLFPENSMNDPQQEAFMVRCIQLCTIRRGSSDYNPLMLVSLAKHLNDLLSSHGLLKQLSTNFTAGMKHLIKLEKDLRALEGDRSQGMEVFFHKLQTTFSLLEEKHRELFLDIALFTPGENFASKQLRLRGATLKESLQRLRDVSFLEKHEMLDVHRDFAKGLARKSTTLLYMEHRELKLSHLREITNCLNRVAFVKCTFPMAKADLDISSCKDIRVLLLDGNKGLNSVIVGSDSLQSLEIRPIIAPLVVTGSAVQGIEMISLLNQRFAFPDFKCLAILELGGTEGTIWSFDVAQIKHCDLLEVVHLYNIDIPSGTLELPAWPNLKELQLSRMPNMKVLSGLEHLYMLRKLHLSHLSALRSLSGVQLLGKLKAFAIATCEILDELKLPGSLKHCSIKECDTLRKVDVVSVHDHVAQAESSDDGDIAVSENRFIVNDCGNLQEINGLFELTSMHSFFYSAPEKGQLSSLQLLDFRHGISRMISCFEFHGNPSIWGPHVLALELGEKRGLGQGLRELLQYAVGLKSLKLVCADFGVCGCDENPPSFHLLSNIERLEYRCSRVVDLSTLEQCSRLRSLHLHGCVSLAQWPNFTKLSLSEYCGPRPVTSGQHLNLFAGCGDVRCQSMTRC